MPQECGPGRRVRKGEPESEFVRERLPLSVRADDSVGVIVCVCCVAGFFGVGILRGWVLCSLAAWRVA